VVTTKKSSPGLHSLGEDVDIGKDQLPVPLIDVVSVKVNVKVKKAPATARAFLC